MPVSPAYKDALTSIRGTLHDMHGNQAGERSPPSFSREADLFLCGLKPRALSHRLNAMKPLLWITAAMVLSAGLAEHASAQAESFREAARAINDTIRAHHFDRASLGDPRYRQLEQQVLALGEQATTADEFLKSFNEAWSKGPFSHVGLRKADQPAAARIASLDNFVAGPEAVTLQWQDSTAILEVTTMTGADTIAAINAAYVEIARRKPQKLIVDLRQNGGGAFAVVPLVGHLVDEPFDAGVFVTQSWYEHHRDPPTVADFPTAVPWQGYSIAAFQADILSRPLTSYRITPLQPRFTGPVYVLTGKRSWSAAEIAADALQSIGRAKVVGEKTPGVVLSSKLFDIPGGLHLRVPIADYYSRSGKRLEGSGVMPDIAVSAEQALEAALAAKRE